MKKKSPERPTVVCAAIIRDDRCFVAKRGSQKSNPHKWEFPGGKVERGEGMAQALVREIAEELTAEIKVVAHLASSEYWGLCFELFLCSISAGELCPLEHEELRWCTADELLTLDWTPADREFSILVAGWMRQKHEPEFG